MGNRARKERQDAWEGYEVIGNLSIPTTVPVFIVAPLSAVAHDVRVAADRLAVGNRQHNVFFCESIHELYSHIKEIKDGVIVFHVFTRTEKFQAIAVMRKVRAELDADRVKIVVLASILELENERFFYENGANTVVPVDISFNGFTEIIQKNVIESVSIKDGRPAEDSARQTNQWKDGKTHTIRIAPPLALKSDCWIVRTVSDIRRAMGFWLTDMIGPGPYDGKWKRVMAVDGTEDDFVWEWVPHLHRLNRFVLEEGTWTFIGREPRYNNYRWTFVARAPNLSFLSAKGNLGAKFFLDQDGNFVISKNSKASIGALDKIEEDLERVIIQSRNPAEVNFRDYQKIKKEFGSTRNVEEVFKDSRYETVEEFSGAHDESPRDAGNLEKLKEVFTRVDASIEVKDFIEETVGQELKCVMWSSEQRVPLPCRIYKVDERRQLFYVKIVSREERVRFERIFSDRFSLTGYNDYYFSVELKRARIFFNSRAQFFADSNVVLGLPTRIFEVQRRRSFRLDLVGKDWGFEPVAACFEGGNGQILNISGGGIALSIAEEFKDRLIPGASLKDLNFNIGGRHIEAQANVVYLQDLGRVQGEQRYKIGIKFEKIKVRDVNFIEYLIFEKSREYFSKWMRVPPETAKRKTN